MGKIYHIIGGVGLYNKIRGGSATGKSFLFCYGGC
jgi:hypothetical protein